jgi:predicted secreted hydrolase
MLLAALATWCGSGAEASPQANHATADPARILRFPGDHGSHPGFRIEWWYITGWLHDSAKREFGVQITFFRAKPQLQAGNPSAFNPEHIIIAHAAVADPTQRRLLHTQRAARAVFGLAGAATEDTKVWLDDWHLTRRGETYQAQISSSELALDLAFMPTQPLLLQGQNGYSRKGPGADAASHYYSSPHLSVSGTLRGGDSIKSVTGKAWLDHEWSSSFLPGDAEGWDWIGINLDDGGALMAFRMRSRKSSNPIWSAATLRDATGSSRTFGPGAVYFSALRSWQSPRTGTNYPVAFKVKVGTLEIVLDPFFDDQENDTRRTTGAVYWEGAVTARNNDRIVGRGYLELTGYGQPLAL